MFLNLNKKNVKKVIPIIGLLALVLFATSVSASSQTSTASLSGATYDEGDAIPVHDGTTYINADNSSTSRNSMDAEISRSVKFLPDPTVYSRNVSPNSSIYLPVDLSPSQYYAVADSVRYPINGTVKFTEYY